MFVDWDEVEFERVVNGPHVYVPETGSTKEVCGWRLTARGQTVIMNPSERFKVGESGKYNKTYKWIRDGPDEDNSEEIKRIERHEFLKYRVLESEEQLKKRINTYYSKKRILEWYEEIKLEEEQKRRKKLEKKHCILQ